MSILLKFQKIKRFQLGGHRAPHKPLLILYALAEYQNGKKEILFETAEERLNTLINDFGSMGKARCEFPFVRLSNDGVWEIRNKDGILLPTKADYSPKRLKEMGVTGRFTDDVLLWLKDPKHLEELVQFIITENFPETYYTDLVEALNFTDPTQSMYVRIKRNPEFREMILDAYERQCALCKYQIRSGDQLVGLEAAHIKWHAAKGSDTVDNGMALCAIHHKLFDYGLFSLDDEYQVILSDKANGEGVKSWLYSKEGQIIILPRSLKSHPATSNLEWHRGEVFRD